MTFAKITPLCAIILLLLVFIPSPVAAFGAGNVPSISRIEGHNWRHGDIEDILKTVAFLKGHKWTSLMIKRAYFGNWLRDYSQAVDVGTLKGVQAETLRILVWVLSFLSFGYATGEFEVTAERLGVYRPEEHIDNPRDYADNADARRYDPRLRPPVSAEELAVDPYTGMKNYIANEAGFWATSSGYVKHSFSRSIHFGRVYTSGANGTSGKEADLCEALRCLGQGLHCLEDFAAHTNYVELALRDLGLRSVFPHTGVATELDIRGRRAFPLVTGTFGAVDFLHSVLGEATDHFAQTEVEQMDIALSDAQMSSRPPSRTRQTGSPANQGGDQLIGLLAQLPGAGSSLSNEAQKLRAAADAQERFNAEHGHRHAHGYGDRARDVSQPTFAAPPGSSGGPPGPGIPGMNPNFDPVKTAAQIYPILEFRDRVAKAISAVLEKIPGLQALCEKISETVTLFVLSLLAPFLRPIIAAISAQLKEGSNAVVEASGRHQFEPWTDQYCTDPTHSLLSKDHFSNILNEVAGQVAAVILQYVAPRVIYAWSHPGIPVQQVLDDIVQVFHHPVVRDPRSEIHHNMFETVRKWVDSLPDKGSKLNGLLSSESVKKGRNHQGSDHHHGHASGHSGSGSHSKVRGSEWEKLPRTARSTSFHEPGASAAHTDYPGIATSPHEAHPPYPTYGDYPSPVSSQYPQGSYSNMPPPAATAPYHHAPYQSDYQGYADPDRNAGYQYSYNAQSNPAGYAAYQGGGGGGGYAPMPSDPNAPPPPGSYGGYGSGSGYHEHYSGGGY